MADGPAPPPAPLTLGQRLTAPGAVLAPLTYPAYRRVWAGMVCSQYGALIQAVGAAWLMTELSHSHTMVAVVQASVSLPILLLGVVSGAIADNFDRRHVMLASSVGGFVFAAALAIMAGLGLVRPWTLLAFTLAIGIGTALNAPSWQASVRAQVGHRELPQAVALNAIGFNLARSMGPALGGLLISVAPIPAAFAVNALSYLPIIAVLLAWKPDTPPPLRRPILPSIAAGVGFCFRSRPLRRVLLRGWCAGIGLAAFNALLPALVRDHMHGSEVDFGLVLGAVGVGSVIAALWIGRVRRKLGTEATSIAAMLALGLGTVVMGHVTTLAPMMLTACMLGASWVSLMTTLNVAMQLRSPEEYLGRCLSIYQSLSFGAMALGAWLWGRISDLASLNAAMNAAAAFLIVAAVLLRLYAPMPRPHEGRVHP